MPGTHPYWNDCITHFDSEVDAFVGSYFGSGERRCFLVAGAGFDPRATMAVQMLHARIGNRLDGLVIREERGNPQANLISAADENEAKIKALLAGSQVERIPIFADD